MRQLIIAFSDQDVAQKIRSLLASRGLPVAALCASGAQVLQQASLASDGGVVICPYRFMDMTAREIMRLLPDEYDMLVLATSQQQGAIGEPGIFVLTQPVNGPVLLDSARQLLETRQLRTGGSQAAGRPRQGGGRHEQPDSPASGRSLEDRKIIDQAKYLLMNRRQMTESEAHRYLQRRSMETGIRLVDLSRKLISP